MDVKRMLSVLAVVAAVVVLGWMTFAGPADPQPAVAPSSTAPSTASAQPSAEPSWPVQTREPAEVEPGEGTFVDPAKVDRKDADAVAVATAKLLASHDTAVDTDEYDADTRARAFYLPDLPAAGGEGDSSDEVWLVAQQDEAYSVPAVTDVGVPHDLAEGAKGADGKPVVPYQFHVTYNWVDRDGKAVQGTGTQERIVRLALRKVDGEWVVVERFYGSAEIGDYAGVK